jgi:siroheme synthase
VRGHEDHGKTRTAVDWSSLARLDGTIVCYVGPEQLPHMLQELVSHGRPQDDPAALIYDGTLATQQTTLGRSPISRRPPGSRRIAARQS